MGKLGRGILRGITLEIFPLINMRESIDTFDLLNGLSGVSLKL